MKSKEKLQAAVADLKKNNAEMKAALVKEQPLWKQAVYYALSIALLGGLAVAIITVCYLAAVWLMPQTVQLVTMSIGITGEATVMDVALLIGLPCLMLAVAYGGLLVRGILKLVSLYKPGRAGIKRLLRFKTSAE